MTNAQFFEYLDGGALSPLRLDHVWQYALAIKVCPDEIVQPLTVANSRLAAQFAREEAVFDALDAPNPLHVTVAAVGEAAARELIAAADPATRAEYAADLAMGEYTQEQLCDQYRQLILGEP
jgi:hypothetical protein